MVHFILNTIQNGVSSSPPSHLCLIFPKFQTHMSEHACFTIEDELVPEVADELLNSQLDGFEDLDARSVNYVEYGFNNDKDDKKDNSGNNRDICTYSHVHAHPQRQRTYSSLRLREWTPRYYPPLNFGLVETGLYRSGHPQPVNFPFLESLNLKTIIYVGEKTDNYDYYRWLRHNGIRLVHVPLSGTCRGAADEDERSCSLNNALSHVLSIVVRAENAPILIHSNKGKHRVGVAVAAVRARLQGWVLAAVYDEYARYAREHPTWEMEAVEFYQGPVFVKRGDTAPFVRNITNTIISE